MSRLTERDDLVYSRLWTSPPNMKPSDTAAGMIDLLLKDSGDRPPRIADLACGGGRHAIHAAERGCDVTAVDHNRVAVTGLRERAGTLPITVLESDLVAWVGDQVAGSYDAVICFDATHHISPDPGEVAACIRRMAAIPRQGGFLLVTFLAEVTFGTDEHPPGRLELSAGAAAELLDDATAATETVKRAQRVVLRDVESVHPRTGVLVPTTYRAVRLLRLCRVAS